MEKDKQSARTTQSSKNRRSLIAVTRNLVLVAIVMMCFVLQSTLFRYLEFGGIAPNLLIIAVATIGFMRGKYAGILYGFLAGLLVDIFFGTVIGFFALIYMYLGFVNGYFERIFYPKDIKLPLILFIVSDFIYSIVYYVLIFLLQGKFNFPHYLNHIILPEIIYTIAVSLLLYPCLLVVNSKFDKIEKGS
ncbi:MAG: rod shape-determining protein MreD [Eubacteriales bacterium]